MGEDRKAYLNRRIRQLRSKQQYVGPFRYVGIQRSIDSMKAELKQLCQS